MIIDNIASPDVIGEEKENDQQTISYRSIADDHFVLIQIYHNVLSKSAQTKGTYIYCAAQSNRTYAMKTSSFS